MEKENSGNEEKKHFYASVVDSDEKNFANGYPFQRFDSFYTFVKNTRPYKRGTSSGEYFIPSIRLLLIVSLCKGIKVSQLIQLKWSDILDIDGENRTNIKSTVEWNKLEFNMTMKLHREFKFHYAQMQKPKVDSPVFGYNDGTPINPRNLSRDIRKCLDVMQFQYAEMFETKSTLIMFGRRVLEVHGYSKRTINELKKHLKFRTEMALLEFLELSYNDVEVRPITAGLLSGL